LSPGQRLAGPERRIPFDRGSPGVQDGATVRTQMVRKRPTLDIDFALSHSFLRPRRP
jgi:hypothetical protein